MAKTQPKKKSNSTRYLLIAGVAVIVYLVAFPAEDTKATAKAKPAVKKKTDASVYLPVDYAALSQPYAPLKGAIVDAFKPQVIRGTHEIGGNDKGGWPISLGGPGWTYSGMAVVGGVGEGLLENTSTGESVLLQRGDKWAGAKAGDIYPDHMIFIRPEGPVTVSVDDKESATNTPVGAVGAASTALPAPNSPLQVPLTGDIGSGDQSAVIVQDNTGIGRRPGRGNGRRRGRNAG